jgi:hypothetical protein
MAHQSKPSVVVSGLLVPINWAADGQPSALGIAAFGEQNYILELPYELKSYMSHLRKEVKVQGVITCETRGKKLLKVNQLTIIGK